MAVQLEVGKWYRRKDGEIRKIVKPHQTLAGYFQDDKLDWYKQDGRRDCLTSHFDLVEEFQQKLEVGKHYRRYTGETVRVIKQHMEIDADGEINVEYVDDALYVYTENGNRDISSISMNCCLLEEVPDISPIQKRFRPYKPDELRALKGVWIRRNDEPVEPCSVMVTRIFSDGVSTNAGIANCEKLLEKWVFDDGPNEGKPVGKAII